MWRQGTRQPWTTAFIGKDPSRKKYHDCCFCEGSKTVRIELANKSGTAALHCRICKASWSCAIHYLEEEVDVHDRWLNACKQAAVKEVCQEKDEVHQSTKAEASAAAKSQEMGTTRKLLAGKRIDLNKLTVKKLKTELKVRPTRKSTTVPKKQVTIVQNTGKKRKTQANNQIDPEASASKKVKLQNKIVKNEPVQLTKEDLDCLLDASSDEDDDGLEKELELALAAEAARERELAAVEQTDIAAGTAALQVEKEVKHREFMEQQQIKQEKLNTNETLPTVPEQCADSNMRRTSSYDSLFGSTSSIPETMKSDLAVIVAKVESSGRSIKIEVEAVTKSIDDNFAALHAAFGLGDKEENIEITSTKPHDLGEEHWELSKSRQSSCSTDSLFDESG